MKFDCHKVEEVFSTCVCHLAIHKHGFHKYGCPKTFASMTIFTKCDVKTSFGKQDCYILKAGLELTYAKTMETPSIVVFCVEWFLMLTDNF